MDIVQPGLVLYRGGEDGRWWTDDRDTAHTYGYPKYRLVRASMPVGLRGIRMSGDGWNAKIDREGIPEGYDYAYGVERTADAPWDSTSYYFPDPSVLEVQ